MSAIASGPASRNKIPITTTIQPVLNTLLGAQNHVKVIEIASGTGEHAAYFSTEISNLLYLPTEPDITMHESIKAWCKDLTSVLLPLQFDINNYENDLLFPIEFQGQTVDCIICINMIHISQIQSTHSLFKFSSQKIRPGGIVVTYGPYRIGGFMVESNVAFDLSLKNRNPEWGIRDLELIVQIANENGFSLEQRVEMPANNLTLIFRKL